ncbi:MAG: hypothetical protein WC458_02420 [Patescibacteria group bacterium]
MKTKRMLLSAMLSLAFFSAGFSNPEVSNPPKEKTAYRDFISIQNGDKITVIEPKTVYEYENPTEREFSGEELSSLYRRDTVSKKYSRRVITTWWLALTAPQIVEEKYFIRGHTVAKGELTLKTTGAAKIDYLLLFLMITASFFIICLGNTVQKLEYKSYWQKRGTLIKIFLLITAGILVAALLNRWAINGLIRQREIIYGEILCALISGCFISMLILAGWFDRQPPLIVVAYWFSVAYAGVLTVMGDQDSWLAGGYFGYFLMLFAVSFLIGEITIIRDKRRKGNNVPGGID